MATEEHDSGKGISRRGFLARAGAVAGGVALTGAAGIGLTGCPEDDETVEETTTTTESSAGEQWDESADIIVVGSGAAALSAACAAANEGDRVIVLERSDIRGGTTAKSGGVYWIPNNHLMQEQGLDDRRDAALAYIARLGYPRFYNPDQDELGLPEGVYQLLETFYDRGSEAIQALSDMGALQSTQAQALQPGDPPEDLAVDYQAQLSENEAPRGRGLGPAPQGAGAQLVQQLADFAEQNGVQILLSHRVVGLIQDGQGEVVGVRVEADEAAGEQGEATTTTAADDQEPSDGPAPGDETTTTGAGNGQAPGTAELGPGNRRFQARKAVIFGSGGFTHNPDFRRAFLRGPIFGGCAVSTCQGDFVTIGTRAGAELGNMDQAWWGQLPFELAAQNPEVPNLVWLPYGHSMLMVNKYGERIVNEKQVYNERTQVHFHWNPSRLEYSNLLVFMIYDDKVTQDDTAWAFRYPVPMPDETPDYLISGGSWEELADNIGARLEQYAEQTGNFSLDGDFVPQLEQTVQRFNQLAEQGQDEDFMRGESPIQQDWHGPPGSGNNTMASLNEQGPHYCIILGAGTLDTKGGPRINSDSQVLNAAGEPIPRLYGAGNCIASPMGQSYPAGGGTLGPALTFGYIAGLHASQLSPSGEAEVARLAT